MRVVIHDFGGYPYPIELSRALAKRGHQVLHVYCASLDTTPGGAFERRPDDPDTFEIAAIELEEPLRKFSFVKRWRQEREYGRLAAREVISFKPDVVVSANAPLDAQRILVNACRADGVRFVFWVQDLIGVAAERILTKRIPFVGRLIGRYYVRLERTLLRSSDEVVLLTDDFVPLMVEWKVPADRVHVIENWAPLHELPVVAKKNEWAREMQLDDKLVFIYAGTLAMKHNPDLLLQLALELRAHRDARLVVLSQGPGADWLREKKAVFELDNLLVQGFVPFEKMPQVMGAADVLVAILEADAGVFSVPSKVLAYLCGGRALLLSIPSENLAARIVRGHEAGLVIEAGDLEGFVAAASKLASDGALRARLGANARRYAEQTFDIESIAERFEQVLRDEHLAPA